MILYIQLEIALAMLEVLVGNWPLPGELRKSSAAKRHKYKEQTFGLCGRRREWDDLRKQHWNMNITMCKIDHQSKFDAWNKALKAGALGQPWGMGWGGKREGVSGRRTHVHPWLVPVSSVQFSSVQLLSHVRLFEKPKNCSMPGFPVHHQLPELAQTHVHQVSDAIQPCHPLSSPSPPAFNLSKHQGLF